MENDSAKDQDSAWSLQRSRNSNDDDNSSERHERVTGPEFSSEPGHWHRMSTGARGIKFSLRFKPSPRDGERYEEGTVTGSFRMYL